MVYLVISFFIVNILHGYLLVNQRQASPQSISYHSIKNRLTLICYAVVHILAGVLLGLFIKTEFGLDNILLVTVAAIAILAEWIQAVLPAKGKTDKAHTAAAGVMALFLILLVLICTFIVNPPAITWLIGVPICLALLFFLSQVRYPPAKNTWKMQFIGQNLLYLQMFLLVY